MPLSQSESKVEFDKSKPTGSLGRSDLEPPEIQIIEKGIKGIKRDCRIFK